MARTLVASDNFNRAGPALGSNWLQLNNWASGDCTIDLSTTLKGAGSLPLWAAIRWAGTGTFGGDQYSKATLLTLEFQSTNYGACAIARASADVNTSNAQMDFYAAVVYQDSGSGGSHTTALIKVVNGTNTTLGATVGVVYTNGDTVEIECEGTTIRFLKNGVEQYNRTDSSLATGVPGLMLAGSMTTRMDDWEGGSLTSAITLTGANASQANASGTGAVSITYSGFTAAASTQANASAPAAIGLRIPLTGTNAAQANASSTGAVAVGQQFAAANSSQTNSSSAVLISVGGTLVSVPLVNNTNTLLANLPVTVYVHDVATGALRVKKTGISTDATGKWSFSDAAIAKSGPHRCVTVFGDGAEGLDTYNGF